MIDFCILRYRRVAAISEVEAVQLLPETQLLLTGGDFRGVTEVRINDVPIAAASTNLVDRNHILVTLPKSMTYVPVRKVDVFVDVPDPMGADRMEFRLTGGMRSGLDRLAQMVVMLLFTTPGSDLFEPEAGGGLSGLLDGDSDTLDRASVVGSVVNAVSRVSSYIINKQRNRRLAPEDTLVGVHVENVAVDPASLRVLIELRVVSKVADSIVSVTTGRGAGA